MTFFPLFKVHCKLTVINLVEVDFSLGSIRQRTFFFFFFCGKGGGGQRFTPYEVIGKGKESYTTVLPNMLADTLLTHAQSTNVLTNTLPSCHSVSHSYYFLCICHISV